MNGNTRQYHGIQIVVDGHEVGRCTSFVPKASKHYDVLAPLAIRQKRIETPTGVKTVPASWFEVFSAIMQGYPDSAPEPDHLTLEVTGENPDAWPPLNCTMTIQHPGGPEEPVKSLEVTESGDWIVEMPDGKIWRYCGVTVLEKEST